jgi:hypothetical protein
MSGFEFRSMSTSSPTPHSYAQIPSTSLPFNTRLAPSQPSQTPISSSAKFNFQNLENKFPIDFVNFYQSVSNQMLFSSYQNLIRQNILYPNNQFQFSSPVLNSFNHQVPIQQTHYESPIVNQLEAFTKDSKALSQQDLAHHPTIFSSNCSSSSSISSSGSSSSTDKKVSNNKFSSPSYNFESADALEVEKKHIYQ